MGSVSDQWKPTRKWAQQAPQLRQGWFTGASRWARAAGRTPESGRRFCGFHGRAQAPVALRIARGANGSGRCWRARLRPACASGDNGAMTAPCNIAAALPRLAAESPDRIAMRCPGGRGPDGMTRYDVTLTYGELDARSDAI